jgi:hypothetical protein
MTMCPRTKVRGRSVPKMMRPLNYVSLTDMSRPCAAGLSSFDVINPIMTSWSHHSPSKGLLARGHIIQETHRQGVESPGAFVRGTSVRDELILDYTRCNWRWTWIRRDRNMLWRIGWIEKRMFPFTGKIEGKASCLKKSSNYHRLPFRSYQLIELEGGEDVGVAL